MSGSPEERAAGPGGAPPERGEGGAGPWGVDVTLLVPCRDEAEALPRLFPAILGLASQIAPRSLEALFIDDGSADRTPDLVIAFAGSAVFPARLFRLVPGLGVGAALRFGFREALGRAVVTFDADLAYPMADVPRLLDALRSADVVTASPYHPEGSAGDVRGIRLLASLAASALWRLRFRGRGVRTFTCGFRAYRREALPGISPRSDGFVATAEILARALRRGLRVAEIPSTLRARTEGRSKMRVLRTALAHLRFLATPGAAGPRRGDTIGS